MKRPALLFFALWLALAGLAVPLAGCGGHRVVIAESDETVDNWMLARRYQAEGRYELAKQHYSLALSAVRTESSLQQLQREMYALDMQIRAVR